MNTFFKRFFSALLALAMVFCVIPFNVSFASAPASPNTYVTGDIIEYGSYPQTKATDSSLIVSLNSGSLSADNTVTFGGAKYKKVRFTQYTPYMLGLSATTTNSWQDDNGYLSNTTYWFKFEPIQWRVLSNTGGEILLMAEKILDSTYFKQTDTSATWETSDMRTWLNNTFYNTAFSPTERSRIKTSEVDNPNNPWTGTYGGNDTSDKLYVLAYSEADNPAYGFSSNDSENDVARRAQGTDYSKSRGLQVNVSDPYSGNSYWWLRSPGNISANVGFVGFGGNGIGFNSCNAKNTDRGVRPVFVLSKSPLTYLTGDIIEYGSYPQSQVTDNTLINNISAGTLSSDNTVTYGGEKYKKIKFSQYSHFEGGFTTNPQMTFQDNNGYLINTVYWFKFEPVQWRVLSNSYGKLLVMAVKILDSKAYNSISADITWQNCSIRTWLNGDFFNAAFSAAEQAMIKTSSVINENNLNGTPGGNATTDKVFLLSYSQSINSSYGFSSNGTLNVLRQVQGTDYSKSSGLFVNSGNPYIGNSKWWLRSPGNVATNALIYDTNGTGNTIGEIVETACLGIRPVLRLNLNSDTFTSAEGSDCIVNYENKFIYGLKTGLTSLSGYVDVAGGYALAYVPTNKGFGTGTVVNVTLAGAMVESYKIIIFGDVNGDGNIDSMDAGTAVDVENKVIVWNPATDAIQYLAGDVNNDKNVDSIDAGIMVDFENAKRTINQMTGIAPPN